MFVFHFCGSCALFMRLASMKFNKINFKIEFYSTIHTFKNYFVTVFSISTNKRYLNRRADVYKVHNTIGLASPAPKFKKLCPHLIINLARANNIGFHKSINQFSLWFSAFCCVFFLFSLSLSIYSFALQLTTKEKHGCRVGGWSCSLCIPSSVVR